MSSIELLKKIQTYDKPHCYQYQKRLDNLEDDKEFLHSQGWTDEDIENINLNDFVFENVTSKDDKKKCSDFISRHEWLGTIGSYPTFWFTASYKDVLFGVIIMSMPNAFSKLLGEETKNLERLIARGASSSLAPQNLGSKFLKWCMQWMVHNTQYRVFTAYSDTTARETGQIYRSLGFYLLKQKAGTTIRCINPFNPNVIITDRAFRARSFYKKISKMLGIEWQKNWNTDQSILWENIPDDIEQKLRNKSKELFQNSTKISFPPKLKWVYILGKNKKETRELRKKFEEMNKIADYDEARQIRESFNKT